KEAWTYTGGGARCDIGRWLFVAHAKGLSGFLRNGYQYVNSDAYYDFSDTEGSWAQVYPSKNGIAATVGWERTAEGVNDYRYLKTLRTRIEAARKAGAHKAEADAAEAFLSETLKGITLHDERTADLKGDEWVAFRNELAKHIIALKE
ncbi:MAG TPA: glycoside hydrolase domain-containing protein, partial [Tepidisphaeraceae bacterium]|nr:glycoside hydrolase domain-containing protein [Tepidisphaeraceae bacterium]